MAGANPGATNADLALPLVSVDTWKKDWGLLAFPKVALFHSRFLAV